MDVEPDIGMILGEVDEAEAKLGVAEGAGRRDPDRPLGLARRLAGLLVEAFQIRQDRGGARQVDFAGGGQRDLARRAVDQERAEFVLQFADIFRQQRLGSPGLAGRRREPLVLHDRDEGAHPRQSIHGAPSEGLASLLPIGGRPPSLIGPDQKSTPGTFSTCI